ncbi:MAG: 16S rRNA (guanine(966)-N(2))-methyltransferase RsmD [Bacteroidales bacterium]
MRVIAGKYKGRHFSPEKSFKGRPTTDQAREGLFNVLMHKYNFEDISVLDLFAGTGSISFEFISRGVSRAIAVDLDGRSVQGIKRVASELGVSTELELIRSDAFRYLETNTSKHDIIFADPPYDMKNFDDIIEKVLGSNSLRENGIFILEHPKRKEYSNVAHFEQMRKYGGVHFTIFNA